MEISITGRHFELTEPIKKHVMQKVDNFNKFLNSIIDVNVILSLEDNIRHIAEIIVTARDIKFFAKEQTEDLYISIDKAVDTIEKQLKRHKERMKAHHAKHNHAESMSESESQQEVKDEKKPSIIVNYQFLDKPMDPEEAAMELEVKNLIFFVFKDTGDNNKIKVIYKRKDENYGLIEPS